MLCQLASSSLGKLSGAKIPRVSYSLIIRTRVFVVCDRACRAQLYVVVYSRVRTGYALGWWFSWW